MSWLESDGSRRIKSNGGDGYVKNVVFDNFIGIGTAYACEWISSSHGLHAKTNVVDIDSFWSSASKASGNGVQYSNITFSVSVHPIILLGRSLKV